MSSSEEEDNNEIKAPIIIKTKRGIIEIESCSSPVNCDIKTTKSGNVKASTQPGSYKDGGGSKFQFPPANPLT